MKQPSIFNYATYNGKCFEKAIYSDTVILSKTETHGFQIVTERCCRSITTNLSNDINGNPDQGYMIYAFIPPAGTVNNSVQIDPEYPWYYNVNDTAYVHFSSDDAESDSVVITIISPNKGGSASEPMPNPPVIFTGLKLVTFAADYFEFFHLAQVIFTK